MQQAAQERRQSAVRCIQGNCKKNRWNFINGKHMNYKVIYGKNDLVYTGFLALPGKLYQKNELTQDYDTEYKYYMKNTP